MTANPNLLKGNLDLILLSILERTEMYGLEIIKEAQARTDGPSTAPTDRTKTLNRRIQVQPTWRRTRAVLRNHQQRQKNFARETRRISTLQSKRRSLMGQIMNNLEQYLKTASRGTYGKTRVLIRAELEANIRIRSKELEHHGLTETQAINRALEELGTPNFVSTGMTGVYTMKTFKKAVLPLSITAALFAATLPFGVAQIQA
jgi:hypothetical protein